MRNILLSLGLSGLLCIGCSTDAPRVRYVNVDVSVTPERFLLGAIRDSPADSVRGYAFLCIDHPPQGSVDEVLEVPSGNLLQPAISIELYLQGLREERDIRHYYRRGFQGRTFVKSSFTEELPPEKQKIYEQLDAGGVVQGLTELSRDYHLER